MSLEIRSRGFARWGGGAIAALVLLAIFTGVSLRLWQYGVYSPLTDPLDFRAFYCAGATIARRENPYRVEPDSSCQRAVLAAAGLGLAGRHVLPAPLPPYALEAFAPLTRLPFRLAAALWLAAGIFALGISLYGIRELSGMRPAIVVTAMFFAAGVLPLAMGQLVPIVLAAVLVAALAARRGNGVGAALGATVASLEPHLALPVWLGLGLFVPVARKPLLIAGAALLALTLLPGVALNLEYVRSVLPAHARSELLNFGEQYGLSPLLVAFHVPFESALRAGGASYAFMLAFGLALGAALGRRTGDAAFLVTAPLACVVLGGPFLHIHQTVVAMPLAFMLAGRLPRRSLAFGAAAIAVLLLAVPWQFIAETLPFEAAATGPITAAQRAVLARPVRADESIEIPYTAFRDVSGPRIYRRSVGAIVAWKLPTWLGLIVLFTGAALLAYGNVSPVTARPVARVATAP